MKIAFVGKGGSGKTTLSSLFCRFLASQQLPVLAIDADINQHMALALGMPEAEAVNVSPMGLEINRIKEYLRGDNIRIHSDGVMIKTTPPGTGSRLVRLLEDNPIYSYFQRQINGVRFMATGPFSEDDLGTKCYHSKVGAIELFLNHLVDGDHEYVVVDMTAGADSFASGMFTKFDITFVVVEPTLKSLSVYDQYKFYAKDYGVKLKVIGNKIEGLEDIEFIQSKVGDDYLTSFHKSNYVRKMERGEYLSLEQLEHENSAVLQVMRDEVNATEKDWDRFYKYTVEFHIKNAQSWANATAGEDLTLQVDPNYNFRMESNSWLVKSSQ